MKIIYVHGINNEDNTSDVIINDWTEALLAGCNTHGLSFPSGVRIEAAFYGDVLAKATDDWGKSTGRATTMSASEPEENTVSADHGAFYQEFQRALGLSDEELKQFLSENEVASPMAAGFHKKWLKAITRALEKVLPTKGRYVARLFLKQAAAYLHADGLKEEIDGLVREQVFDSIANDERTVVISHSLGTIVAYDLLRKMHSSGKQVQLFLTAGSPLGIEIVKKRLGPPLCMPKSIKGWVNASDPEDFVALKKDLNAKSFADIGIINHSSLDNGHADAHDIRKYLGHREIVEAIVNGLE